jgi:hypothetical protein
MGRRRTNSLGLVLTIPAAGVIAALSYGIILVIKKVMGAVA